MKYSKFLQSPWWKHIRKKALHKGKHRCKACGSRYSLIVHHYNYRYKYSGSATKATKDTIVLCSSCHHAFHEKYGVKGDLGRQTDDFIKDVNGDLAILKKMQKEFSAQYAWWMHI